MCKYNFSFFIHCSKISDVLSLVRMHLIKYKAQQQQLQLKKKGMVEGVKWKVNPPLGLQSRYLRLNSFPIHPVPAGPLGSSEPSGKNSPEDNKQSKLGYRQWLLRRNRIIILTSYSKTMPNQKSHIVNGEIQLSNISQQKQLMRH